MWNWLFGPKKYTRSEVEDRVRQVKPGIDPDKLKKIVDLLMTILSALLPIFMNGDSTDPKLGRIIDSLKV